MTLRISENVRNLEPSATLAVAARARELREAGRDIIDLGAGEPDFPTPGFIADAAIAAIRAGHTRYTAAPGIVPLRQAIARDMARRHGKTVDAAGIIVTAGAKQALFNAIFTLFGPGDRVIVPAPYWTSYPALIQIARAEPVFVTGAETRGFKVTPADLDQVYDERVRGLILNSPSNPTGAVYSLEELAAVVRWARERDVWVISDEIYGRICYVGDRAPGLLDLDPAPLDHAVIIDGTSKTFSMTGWRIGYSYSTPELALRMSALQSHITSNATTPAQYAALAAYSADENQAAEVRAMVDTFRKRRDLVVERFHALLPGVEFVSPEGAFYLFFRIDRFFDADTPDSIALCRALIENAGVAVVPGAAFGDDRYARISFAASEQALNEGIRRIAEALGSTAGQEAGR